MGGGEARTDRERSLLSIRDVGGDRDVNASAASLDAGERVIPGSSRAETLRWIVEHGRARGGIVVVDPDLPRLADPEPDSDALPPAAAPDLVWLRSGGTTGRPRWSPVDVGARAAHIFAWNLRETGWAAGMTQLSVLPLHHAAGLTTAVAGLEAGNDLLFLPRFSPASFVHTVTREKVQWACVTPAHMALVRRDGLLDELSASPLSILHTGGPCPHDLKRAWIEALGGDRVSEMYSSTEQSGMTVATGAEWIERPGTVGRGRMTRVRILRPSGEEAEVGEVGDVVLSPMSRREPSDARGWGDRGYVDADGFLYLTGRSSESVNIGGELVDLQEVLAVVRSVPGVDEAAVRPMADDVLGWVLGVVALAEGSVDRTAVKRAIRESLPAAAKPRRVVFVEEWPADSRGKTPASLLDAILKGEPR
ncbi:AMP-binding protein [uncultured Microbacterium sp.]|uniref:AMP-binding protein n=1 Tax=uncultured Microbacterium sp. TaxID=191216 RepID=UPI0028D0E8E4|nr:AMP-binding protein [uncultured Microbacterium sp.]